MQEEEEVIVLVTHSLLLRIIILLSHLVFREIMEQHVLNISTLNRRPIFVPRQGCNIMVLRHVEGRPKDDHYQKQGAQGEFRGNPGDHGIGTILYDICSTAEKQAEALCKRKSLSDFQCSEQTYGFVINFVITSRPIRTFSRK
jgi:hypothetical protein